MRPQRRVLLAPFCNHSPPPTYIRKQISASRPQRPGTHNNNNSLSEGGHCTRLCTSESFKVNGKPVRRTVCVQRLQKEDPSSEGQVPCPGHTARKMQGSDLNPPRSIRLYWLKEVFSCDPRVTQPRLPGSCGREEEPFFGGTFLLRSGPTAALPTFASCSPLPSRLVPLNVQDWHQGSSIRQIQRSKAQGWGL